MVLVLAENFDCWKMCVRTNGFRWVWAEDRDNVISPAVVILSDHIANYLRKFRKNLKHSLTIVFWCFFRTKWNTYRLSVPYNYHLCPQKLQSFVIAPFHWHVYWKNRRLLWKQWSNRHYFLGKFHLMTISTKRAILLLLLTLCRYDAGFLKTRLQIYKVQAQWVKGNIMCSSQRSRVCCLYR